LVDIRSGVEAPDGGGKVSTFERRKVVNLLAFNSPRPIKLDKVRISRKEREPEEKN
jgi:hypothetical protein